MTVRDVEEPAAFRISGLSDATVNENAPWTSSTPSLTEAQPTGDVAWTLEGTDAEDFTIDAATGVVSMEARDHEDPVDDDVDNVYEVTVRAKDGIGKTITRSITVTVADVTETAVFTIDELLDDELDENAPWTSATPSTSGDEPIEELTWTLEGADAGDFTIDARTGVVSMVSRSYEDPQDENADNVYEVTVWATDADENDDDESFTVTVTDVEEAAVFTIDSIAGRSVAENAPFTAATPSTSGEDPIGELTWTLEGDDAGDFTIDAMTGVVSMVMRDYEDPQDENADNVYEVTLLATDADGNDDDESFTVTVTDVEEAAVFTIDSIAGRSVAENAPFTATTPSTSGEDPIGELTWTLEGDDAGDFTVDAATGVVSMVARSYEDPQDENADNVYEVTLWATDADDNDDDESFTVTVTDVEEAAVFTIDSIAGRSVAENARSFTMVARLRGPAGRWRGQRVRGD